MSTVYVLSAYPESRSNSVAAALRLAAKLSPRGDFTLATDPAKAELIVFAEAHPVDDPLFFRVALHPLRRRYAWKCFLYSDTDYAFPLMRGLYPSLSKSDADLRLYRGVAYYGQVEVNPFVAPKADFNPSYLATFAGACTHPLRSQLFAALANQGEFHLRDTTGRQSWTLSQEDKLSYHRDYSVELTSAAFVLCPRGIGPSSYRLFEAMKAGRCPVILADEWTPPHGPDWDQCALVVREAKLIELPGILRDARPRAHDLGRQARLAWERWFSPDVAFSIVARQCQELLSAGGSPRYRWEKTVSHGVWRHAVRGLIRQRSQLPGLLATWIRTSTHPA